VPARVGRFQHGRVPMIVRRRIQFLGCVCAASSQRTTAS
jgi:hypothetical protein